MGAEFGVGGWGAYLADSFIAECINFLESRLEVADSW